MSGKIPVGPGDRLKITIRRKRRGSDEMPGSSSAPARGILPVSQRPPRYIRRGSISLEFFDLGQIFDETWRTLFFEGVMPITVAPGNHTFENSFTVGLPPDLWPGYTQAVLDLPSGQTFQAHRRQITYPGSSMRLLDVWLYNDETHKKQYAISEPGSRGYLVDKRFGQTPGTVQTPEWGENHQLTPQTGGRHLRVTSGHLFEEFDTGDTAIFKITNAPDYMSDEVELNCSSGALRIYLVPRLFSEQTGESGTMTIPGSTGLWNLIGQFAMVPFPRADEYQSLSIADGDSSMDITILDTPEGVGRNTQILYDRAVNRSVFYRTPTVVTSETTVQTFDAWASSRTGTPTPGRPLSWDQSAGWSSPDSAEFLPDEGALAGIIERSGQFFYIWRKVRATSSNYKFASVVYDPSVTNAWELQT